MHLPLTFPIPSLLSNPHYKLTYHSESSTQKHSAFITYTIWAYTRLQGLPTQWLNPMI